MRDYSLATRSTSHLSFKRRAGGQITLVPTPLRWFVCLALFFFCFFCRCFSLKRVVLKDQYGRGVRPNRGVDATGLVESKGNDGGTRNPLEVEKQVIVKKSGLLYYYLPVKKRIDKRWCVLEGAPNEWGIEIFFLSHKHTHTHTQAMHIRLFQPFSFMRTRRSSKRALLPRNRYILIIVL